MGNCRECLRTIEALTRALAIELSADQPMHSLRTRFSMLHCLVMSDSAILHHLRISADFRIADTPGAINADFDAKMFFPDPTLSGQEI
jgi:hypothetical protein